MFQLSEQFPDGHSRLEMFYHQYVSSMWYVASSFVKDDQIAEDMVHDTFVKLAQNPGIFDRIPDCGAKGFLAMMVSHQCIDYLRKRKRYPEEAYGDYIDTRMVPIEFMPLERLVQEETVRDICLALRELPESFRTPLELHILYSLSNQEIADLLGITKNLVAVRINRGRNKILKALKKDRPDSLL